MYASAPRARAAPRARRGLGLVTERRYGYFPPQQDAFTRFATAGTMYLVLGPLAPRLGFAGAEPIISARASGAKGWLSGTWDTDGLINPETGQLNDSYGQMVATGFEPEDLTAIAAQLAPAANINDPAVQAAIIAEIGQTLEEGGAIAYDAGTPVLQWAQTGSTTPPPADEGIFICSELGEDAQMAQERNAKLLQYGVKADPYRCVPEQFELWLNIIRKEVSEGGYRVASPVVSAGQVLAWLEGLEGAAVVEWGGGGIYTGSERGEEAFIPTGGTFYEPTGERIEWDPSTLSVRRTGGAGEGVAALGGRNWLPWLLGGGALLLFTRRRGRRK